MDDDDIIAEIQRRKAERQARRSRPMAERLFEPQSQEATTATDATIVSAPAQPVPASPLAVPTEQDPETPELQIKLTPKPVETDKSEAEAQAQAAAAALIQLMRASGGWRTLGDDVTGTLHELGNRMLEDPERASEPARAACRTITTTALDKLETRIHAVAVAWASGVEGTILTTAPLLDIATTMLAEALSPAIEQAQTIVDAVGALTSRGAAAHPALAKSWQELTRELHGRLASLAATAEEAGKHGTPAHKLARAHAHARAALAAMTPDERKKAVREAAIRRMSPADAATAREADAAAEAAARGAAAEAAAVDQWRVVVPDLVARYPLVAAIAQTGHLPVVEMLRAAGLGKRTISTRKNPDGTTTKIVSEELPTLAAIVETDQGIELEFDPLRGQAVSTWQAALGVLGVELALTSLTVTQRGRRMVVATNDVTSPELSKSLVNTKPVPYDAHADHSYLGKTASGTDMYVTWAGNSGCVVGGVPGSGKTASFLPIYAGMAGLAELHVFDGKAGFDLEPIRSIARTYDASGDIDGPLLSTLDHIEKLRVTRSQALHDLTGESNFWNIPLSTRKELGVLPVFVIIDECQTWLDTSGMDKEEREIAGFITKGVRQIVQKARAAGILMVLTTQKPDGKSIPTVIRDNGGLKVAFRVSTRAQGTTILGDQPDDAPRPTDIPRSTKGRCITASDDGTVETVQTLYVSPADIRAALKGAQPVPDQLVVAQKLLRG